MARIEWILVEGLPDQAVAFRLLSESGIQFAPQRVRRVSQPRFWEQAGRFLQASRTTGVFFALADLDAAGCAPGLLHDRLKGNVSRNFLIRIAVRAVESWLLADKEGLARFLAVPVSAFPNESPDRIPDPKRAPVEIAGQSRKRAVREDMVPAPGRRATAGPGYTDQMREFIEGGHWHPRRAADRSDSLQRALGALHRLAASAS